MQTLLFIGAGLESVHAIRRAQEKGLHVVATDANPEAPGLQAAEDSIVASTYDIQATLAGVLAYHREVQPIDGVISVGVDVPRTIAAVAKALRLRGVSEEAAALSADKLAMKERLARDHIPIPYFTPIANASELQRFPARGDFVLKPVDSRGSRGVQRLIPGLDLVRAFEHAKAQSPSGRVMLEAYLDGAQISTESLVLAGKAHTPGFSDRNYEYLEHYAPYFIENGGELPSRLPAETQEAVCHLIAQAAASIGLTEGPLKGDIVIHKGRPYIIEVATRLSGGFFCTLEIPLNTGVDFVGAVIDWTLGETVEPESLKPRMQRPVVQRYAFPPPGVLTTVPDRERALALPGIHEVVVYAAQGDIIREPSDTTARAAMAIASGTTIEEADSRARRALSALGLKTEPVAEAAQRRAHG